MQYFTREKNDRFNSDDPKIVAAAQADINQSCDLYIRQLESLKARLPEDIWAFFNTVSLHDSTLLAMRVGDDIDKRL